ncbi:hypothetical protein OAS97_11615, partial [Pseudomonadales bacterium]|nr:hypothetical protein [Pseudomonadales bacterium]
MKMEFISKGLFLAFLGLLTACGDGQVKSKNDGDVVAQEQQRLAFEELLAHQISMRFIRKEMSKQSAVSFKPPAEKCDALRNRLA